MEVSPPPPSLSARGGAAYAVAERPPQVFSLAPQNFEQALVLAGYLADSDMVPKDFIGKPGNCLIAIQWGAELGLQPMQAIQNIAVINGRPSLWGDVMLAIVRSSPLCEYVTEEIQGDRAICRAKRRTQPEQVREFTQQDAIDAGLWGKDVWKKYPKRMLQMRARAWALRDVFTDLLKGLHMAEEAMDMPAKDMGPVQYADHFPDAGQNGPSTPPPPASSAPPPPAANKLPTLGDKDFAEKLPTWRGMIASGAKSPERMISFLSTKYTLTEEQKKAIERNPYDNGGATDAKPKEAPVVTVTYAEVIGKMNEAAKAKNRDHFDAAAALIGAIADEQQRAEATQYYETLLEEFN